MRTRFQIIVAALMIALFTVCQAASGGWGNETAILRISDIADSTEITVERVGAEIRLTLILENFGDDETVVSSRFFDDNEELDATVLGALTTTFTPAVARTYAYHGSAHLTLAFTQFRDTNIAQGEADAVEIDRIVQISPSAAEGQEAGPALVFPGTTLTLRADRNPDPKTGAYPAGRPFWWLSQPSDSSLANPADGNGTISITPTVLGSYTVYTSLESILSAADEFQFTVTNVRVQSLVFKAKPGFGSIHPVIKERGLGSYPSTHWEDNSTPLDGDADDLSYAPTPPADKTDKKAPVCFVRASTMRVDVSFKLAATVEATTAMVKGTGPGGLVFETSAPIAVPAGDEVTVTDLVCSGALPDEIKYYESFEIEWEVKLGGADYLPAGTTRNVVYLLRDTPKVGVPLYHTIVHLSCKYGQTASDHDDRDVVTPKMFEAFTGTKSVKQVAIEGEWPERELRYYKPKANAVPGDAVELLKDSSGGNGQCTTFAALFIRMLHVHGIDYANELVLAEATASDGFFVKQWTPVPGAGKSGNPNYPYLNVPNGNWPYANVLTDLHDWKFYQVADATGLPGQNSSDPNSIFGRHVFVRIADAGQNVTYYDPSYGVTYASKDAFAAVLSHYFLCDDLILDEAVIGIDLDGDPATTNRAYKADNCHLLKANTTPAGADVTFTPDNL